jgi:hypothetical protein
MRGPPGRSSGAGEEDEDPRVHAAGDPVESQQAEARSGAIARLGHHPLRPGRGAPDEVAERGADAGGPECRAVGDADQAREAVTRRATAAAVAHHYAPNIRGGLAIQLEPRAVASPHDRRTAERGLGGGNALARSATAAANPSGQAGEPEAGPGVVSDGGEGDHTPIRKPRPPERHGPAATDIPNAISARALIRAVAPAGKECACAERESDQETRRHTDDTRATEKPVPPENLSPNDSRGSDPLPRSGDGWAFRS